MSLMKSILLVLALLASPLSLLAAGQLEQAGAGPAAMAEHGIPQKAEGLAHDEFFITNSMLITWVVALALILFARIATRRMQEVPAGAQNFWEWLVESLQDFLEGIIGHELAKKTFWFFATIFIFILFTNWFGLIPGVGTIGTGIQGEHGFHVTRPIFRGVNADLNMTSAMAMTFF